MIDIEVEDRRRPVILANRLTRADRGYTFYYDESNNPRKVRLVGGAPNVPDPGCFVLAGVVHPGPPRPIDVAPLRNALRLQTTADEFKLKHLAKGDFLAVLGARRIGVFLQWLLEADLHVHVQTLDPIHWSLVDIVDSAVAEIGDVRLMMLHLDIKDALCGALRRDLPATWRLLDSFGYPGLKPTDAGAFLAALDILLAPRLAELPRPEAGLITVFLHRARRANALAFIEGEAPRSLIESFSGFYLDRLCLFAGATHVFDAEDQVRQTLSCLRLLRRGEPLHHYRFADSKVEPAIHLADVLAGLFAKYASYLAATPVAQVAQDRDALSPQQEANRALLEQLVDRSDAENPAFFQHITSLSAQRNNRIFLHGLAG